MLRRFPACFVASAATVISTLAVAAPPEPAAAPEPAVAPEPDPEPDIVAPEPDVVAPAPDVAEPAPDVVAPEPDPEPAPALPAYDAELPSYDDPQVPPEPPEPIQAAVEPLPHDGNGSIAAGTILLGGGALLGTTSVVLMGQDVDANVWFFGAVIAGVAAATGAVATAIGAVRHHRYKRWQLEHAAPPRGTGMLVGGTFSVTGGAIGMLVGGFSLNRQDNDDLPYGEVLLTLGSASVATGIGLLAVSAVRRREFEGWEQLRVTPSLGLIPGPRRLSPAGATVGIAGRF